MLKGRRIVIAAGLVLIALGVGCLVWSYLLAHGAHALAQGWWEGTFQALGVGSIVGGLVDVLAISALNQVQQRQDLKIRLIGILDAEPFSVEDAQAMLKTDRWQLDRYMVGLLEFRIERGLRDAEERKRYEEENIPPERRNI